jgi:hypothetical protein
MGLTLLLAPISLFMYRVFDKEWQYEWEERVQNEIFPMNVDENRSGICCVIMFFSIHRP